MVVPERRMTPRSRRRICLSFRRMQGLTEATQQAKATSILISGAYFCLATVLATSVGEAAGAGGGQRI
jgi:hypothetical protein